MGRVVAGGLDSHLLVLADFPPKVRSPAFAKRSKTVPTSLRADTTLDMHRIPRYYSAGMINHSFRTLAFRAGLVAGRMRLVALAAGPRAPVPREWSAV